jgi:hypothetical protein
VCAISHRDVDRNLCRPRFELRVYGWCGCGTCDQVHDAIAAALMSPAPIDRRQLVMVMTDGVDTLSATDGETVRRLAGRSDAVLHIVLVSGGQATSPPHRPWMAHRDRDRDRLRETAERTGGALHRPGTFGSRTVSRFKAVFEDFRQGYVLHFTPSGVSAEGWHQLDVRVRRPGNLVVRARKGYFGK